MQWVKSRPRHMPRRWVMKCSLPEFIGNRGSFVCNAHECLDKIVPRNANLWNSSSLRGGRTSWRVPERDRGFGSAGHFFSLAKKWLQASAQCTTSRCSAGMPLLSRLWRRRMEKSYRRESLSMVDLGSTSLFLNLVRHSCVHIQKYNSHRECQIIYNRMLSVSDVGVAVSVATDDLFRTGRCERPAIWHKVGQHFGQV